jgi:hypothetical protein
MSLHTLFQDVRLFERRLKSTERTLGSDEVEHKMCIVIRRDGEGNEVAKFEDSGEEASVYGKVQQLVNDNVGAIG